MANVRDYFSKQLSLFEESSRISLSGKTCPAHSLQTGDLILKPSSKKSCKSPFLYLDTSQMQDWLTVADVKSLGESSTLNFSEQPNDVKESFLSQILQVDAPQKYYLSPRACEGILRRAKSHNKILPPELEAVLIRQALLTE